MGNQFSEEIVKQAWARSGGRCECELSGHGHIGKHNSVLLKYYQGDKNSLFGWEAHSKSRLHLNNLSDCQIFCWDPCYKSIIAEMLMA